MSGTLPEFCNGCEKKHTIVGDGETCLVYFNPPHVYVSHNQCPFNQKKSEAAPKKKINALKESKRKKKGLI